MAVTLTVGTKQVIVNSQQKGESQKNIQRRS